MLGALKEARRIGAAGYFRKPVDEVALSVRDPGKAEEAVDAAEERGIAVQCIKSVTRGPWGPQDKWASTWYQPLRDQEDLAGIVR